MTEGLPLSARSTDWAQSFFSSTGRVGRGRFVLMSAALVGLTLGFQHLVTGAAYGWLKWIAYPAVLFSGACILCRRLHDRGRRGWWAGLVLWALTSCWSAPHGVGQVAPAIIVLIALVDLAALPGQPRANRFGPPPNAG